MIIRYKKNRNRIYLLVILFWSALIVSSFVFTDFAAWTDYSVVAVGSLYITIYLSNYINQYLTIESGTIKKNSFFSEKVILSEVKAFNKFAGEYILQTDIKELRIDISLIDESSKEELDKVLSDFNLS